MKSLRSAIFWAHMLTGLTVGAVVVIMAATGALLTYQRQLQAWADTRGLVVARPVEGAAPLDPQTLVLRVQQSTDAAITAIRWQNDPAAPVEVVVGREGRLFMDPYTGAVLGSGSARLRAFFVTVTAAHRWLALGDERRSAGRAVTGAANLAFLFMVLSGFYLWWPRNLTGRAVRGVLLFRRGLRARARDFNWHNVIGIWSAVPLAIIIASAVVISYAWAGALVERAAGIGARANGMPAAQRTVPQVAEGRELMQGAVLLARARERGGDWRSITLQLPIRAGAATFIIDSGTGGQPHRQARLTLSAATGETVAWEPFAARSRAGRLRSLLRFAHTGEVAGVAGQTIAGIASAGVLLLAWTGVSLALRRLAAWRGRGAQPGADVRAVAARRRVVG